MGPWQTAAAISAIGFGTVGSGQVLQSGVDGPISVLVPPWNHGGMAFAAEVGHPIIDIRWGGHLVVFAPTDDPAVISRMGYLILTAKTVPICGAPLDTEVGRQ